jgi:hypothetical protein
MDTPDIDNVQNPQPDNNIVLPSNSVQAPAIKVYSPPSPCSAEEFLTACDELSFNQTSIRQACLNVGFDFRSFFQFLKERGNELVKAGENVTFYEYHARSIERRAQNRVDSMIELSQDCKQVTQKCDPKIANAVVSAFKLEQDAIKWQAARENSRKYGDKLDVTGSLDINTRIVRLPSKVAEGAEL